MATYREFRGQRRMSVPSQFCLELPRDEMEIVEPSYSGYSSRAGSRYDDTNHAEFDDVHHWRDDAAYAPPAPRRSASPSPSRIKTAAELAGKRGASGANVSADEFYQGQVVTHPEYGPGKVIALSGGGPRRTATVAFPAAGEKKFVIEKSQLKPVRNGERKR
jgi:DNA helicase-2/ATP-dependent DNA helicase PcrA